jgi:hypothetical protein
MDNTEHMIVLLMKCVYKDTQKGRKYLRNCQNNLELVKDRPEFWTDMYDDTKLYEEPCEPKSPRIGSKYQCDLFSNTFI